MGLAQLAASLKLGRSRYKAGRRAASLTGAASLSQGGGSLSTGTLFTVSTQAAADNGGKVAASAGVGADRTLDAVFSAAQLPVAPAVPPTANPAPQTEAVNASTLSRGKGKGNLLPFPAAGGVANILKGEHGASA